MGWGGSALAMILSLKANARRKLRPFDRDVEPSAQRIRPEYLRKATEEELQYWRDRSMAIRQAQRQKQWFILVILLLVFLALFHWSC
jgi:hypothetical protein